MTQPIDATALDVLCPMHLILGPEGEILHMGPTLQKMKAQCSLARPSFFDLFEVKRPRDFATLRDLQGAAHNKLHLKLRAAPFTTLKGVIVPTGPGQDTMIVNLSFGISIVDGVRDFALSNADFAATDLAIEMLYLIEAKTAAMDASYRLNARLQGAKNAAEEQAFTDTLTGLKNRRALNATLTQLLEAGTDFAVMQIDLDYFKAVNDTLGHAAGDHVLQQVARIMLAETRAADSVSRVGGDEFTVVLPNVRDEPTLQRIGRRIIQRLEKPISFQGQECRISASIGTVWVQPGQKVSKEDILSDADVALYASKNAGRATQTFYTPELRSSDQDPLAS